MARPCTPLTVSEVHTLKAGSHPAPHPRQRRRALAVLAHSRGQRLRDVAKLFAVRYETARGWLQAWERRDVAGLAEGARAGRPANLDGATKKKPSRGWAPPASA